MIVDREELIKRIAAAVISYNVEPDYESSIHFATFTIMPVIDMYAESLTEEVIVAARICAEGMAIEIGTTPLRMRLLRDALTDYDNRRRPVPLRDTR